MANITGEEDHTPTGIAELFSTLYIFLSITAVVGNALILVALKNVSSIHSPTKILFRCLAVTDLCVGLILQPLHATDLILSKMKIEVNVLYYFNIFGTTLGAILCGVSALTSTAISVDRLLALLLGLRYRQVVTLRRARVVVVCVWLIAVSVGFFLVWKKEIGRVEASVVFLLCLVTSIFCYIRIYLRLRQQQAQIQNTLPQIHSNGGVAPLNIARYKKTVSSIMWVQLALTACFVPWTIAAALNANGIYNDAAWLATFTLLYLNSSLNPILYCWRIREMKQAVKGTIRQLCCL